MTRHDLELVLDEPPKRHRQQPDLIIDEENLGHNADEDNTRAAA
jgi:hypothetical protein